MADDLQDTVRKETKPCTTRQSSTACSRQYRIPNKKTRFGANRLFCSSPSQSRKVNFRIQNVFKKHFGDQSSPTACGIPLDNYDDMISSGKHFIPARNLHTKRVQLYKHEQEEYQHSSGPHGAPRAGPHTHSPLSHITADTTERMMSMSACALVPLPMGTPLGPATHCKYLHNSGYWHVIARPRSHPSLCSATSCHRGEDPRSHAHPSLSSVSPVLPHKSLEANRSGDLAWSRGKTSDQSTAA